MMKRTLIILAFGLLSGFSYAQPTAIENYKTAVIKHASAEYDSAIIYFTLALQENVKLPGSVYGPRGICFYETGRYEEALNDFNKEINLHSDSASVSYCYRGLTKIKLVNYEGAMDDFNSAIKIFPKYALAYKYRGDLSKITGHMDDACADWKTARDYGNNMAGDMIRQYCNP